MHDRCLHERVRVAIAGDIRKKLFDEAIYLRRWRRNVGDVLAAHHADASASSKATGVRKTDQAI